MAKRKSKREAEQQKPADNEELPDAPPQGSKRKNDDSDSDEVHISSHSPPSKPPSNPFH
jgi:hypothetical protein